MSIAKDDKMIKISTVNLWQEADHIMISLYTLLKVLSFLVRDKSYVLNR